MNPRNRRASPIFKGFAQHSMPHCRMRGLLPASDFQSKRAFVVGVEARHRGHRMHAQVPYFQGSNALEAL